MALMETEVNDPGTDNDSSYFAFRGSMLTT